MGSAEFDVDIASVKGEYYKLNAEKDVITSQLSSTTDLLNKLKASQLFDLSNNLIANTPLTAWASHPENPVAIDTAVLYKGKPTLRLGNTDTIPSAGVEAWLPGYPIAEGSIVIHESAVKTNNVVVVDNSWENRCGGRIGVDLRGHTDNRILVGATSPVFHSFRENTVQGSTAVSQTLKRSVDANGWIRSIWVGVVGKCHIKDATGEFWPVPNKALPTIEQFPGNSTGKAGVRSWYAPIGIWVINPVNLV